MKTPVLIVDDRPENLTALEGILADEPLELIRATSGNEALRQLLKHDFALVLLDVQMPEMDGFETAELIRANPKTRHIPIIFVTAGMKETAQQFKGYNAGAVDYLMKPIDPAILVSKVRIFDELYRYRKEIEGHKEHLEALVATRTAELQQIADSLKREAEERRQAESLVESMLETVDEGFIIMDRNFRILSANRAYLKMVNLPSDKVIGNYCYRITHHSDRPCHDNGEECAALKVFETGASHSAVHSHERDENGLMVIETKAYPLSKDETGAVNTVIETLVDITERRRLEEQLHQAQKMESIGTLAGGIAHDFNNILSAIIGYGDMAIMKMAEDSPEKKNIEQMLYAAERAAHLTKDLLLFSRKQMTEKKPANLNDIIRKIETFLSRVIGEDITLTTELHNGELPILADSHQIEQILMNFATNARDAMPKGGKFMISTCPVCMDSEFITAHGYGSPGRYALITVSDTGRGMDQETVKRIFEPFFTTKGVGKGTGLGMAVVYGIIKQHEGHISVYSEPDMGTTFRIYLPLVLSGIETEAILPGGTVPAGGSETILLAEDSEPVRTLTATVLKDFGYEVIETSDGNDAVARFIENADRIDLLLFDLIMPGKTGKDAYDEIHALRPDIRVIFTSGYAPDIIRERSALGEEVPVLSKPASPVDLLKKIRSVLDEERSERKV